uniref:Uncharacterized protein n=1 Tax=Rhizophora mucronata TaxID=61149 RepID=A0A2P2IUK4_RHIMU
MSEQAEELGCSVSMQELVELNNAVFQNQCLISR